MHFTKIICTNAQVHVFLPYCQIIVNYHSSQLIDDDFNIQQIMECRRGCVTRGRNTNLSVNQCEIECVC